MRAIDVVRAITAPLVEMTILVPLLLFWLLIGFGAWAVTHENPGMLVGGILVLLLTLPPLFRFQTHILGSYAGGKAPEPMDAEFFSWIGRMWTLFPLLLAILVSVAGWFATAAWGTAGTWLVIVVASAIVPASLAVLAITHSALQALNPIALFNFFDRAGPSFLVAPLYALATTMLCTELAPLPLSVSIFVSLFLLFSLASLTGSVIAPSRLVDDVYIPDALEPGDEAIQGEVEKERVAVLGHAYGFISRDNRAGGFAHIIDAIGKDPDPKAAWAWYFERMLGWEKREPVLFFAQHYVHDALRHGEQVAALKVIMRCRMIDEDFRPFADDLGAAIAAAEATQNTELATVLKRG